MPYDLARIWNVRNKTDEQTKKDKNMDLNMENGLVAARGEVHGGMVKYTMG